MRLFHPNVFEVILARWIHRVALLVFSPRILIPRELGGSPCRASCLAQHKGQFSSERIENTTTTNHTRWCFCSSNTVSPVIWPILIPVILLWLHILVRLAVLLLWRRRRGSSHHHVHVHVLRRQRNGLSSHRVVHVSLETTTIEPKRQYNGETRLIT